MAEKTGLDRRMERVEELVTALEAYSDTRVRELVRELLATLLDFHAAALARVLESLEEQAPGHAELLSRAARDPLVSNLLLLHGLHPTALETRVREALDEVRPALQKHRGDVELLSIEAGTVQLRLKGTCNGCPSSTATFRNLIEGAILEKAPEIEGIQVEGLVA